MISSKIIADSIDSRNNRLTTFIVTFPRIILSEFNTHRMFSRNSASSRAIPFEKMVKSVEENPFIPIAWQKDHKGMQGNEYYSNPYYIEEYNYLWLLARDKAIDIARSMNKPGDESSGVTKQLCNRLLEPFMWHTVIITSSREGLENFFELRCPQYEMTYTNDKGNLQTDYHRSWIDFTFNAYNLGLENKQIKDWYLTSTIDRLKRNKGQAEIHIMALAESMWDAYNESIPKRLNTGEWHVPFYETCDKEGLGGWANYCNNNPEIDYHNIELFNIWRVKIAIARAARVSYTVIGEEGKTYNYENDIKLYNKLLESKHLSPFEHCAKVMSDTEYQSFYRGEGVNENHIGREENQGWCSNFKGFISTRYMLENKLI